MNAPTSAPGPLLSVVMISFNQEQFIRQALESVLEQRTDFPFEVIVADDASTDGTAQVIRELAEAHPDVVRPILREQNVGIHANLVDALGRTRGTYVALCEGDDYWTDPGKLAAQVSHLEENPTASLCFHPVRVVWTDGSQPDDVFPKAEHIESLNLDGLLAANFIQTNSVVYRRLESYDDIPDVMPLDWYLHLRHAMNGELSMLPDTMAVYRRHPGGIWYDSTTDHDRFWAVQGEGHAALCDSLLELFGSDQGRRDLIARTAARVLGELAQIGSEPGTDSVLLGVIIRHPRWAELAGGSQSSQLVTSAAQLAAARAEVASLQVALEQARQHAANLVEESEKQAARVLNQRARILRQAGRIEKLKARLERTAAELAETQARLPKERLKRQVRRVVGRPTPADPASR